VIQSIDGKPALRFRPTLQAVSFRFEIVRGKEKMTLTVANPRKK
jgi:hypothetical protein